MIIPCDRAVGNIALGTGKDRVADTSICSMTEFPPPLSLKPRVRAWMDERDSLLQTWNLSMIEWDKKYVRASTCNWNLADGQVEITEHDTVVGEF